MREILFKAKRLGNGEWVEGLLTVMWRQYHVINPNDENTAYPIDEKTICQYTGLTDKNGKKIFEGDVCSFADFHSGSDVETYCEGVWSYEGCQLFISDRLSCETEDLICEGKFDGIIIGNIHDNPELLEGGSESSERWSNETV